MQKRYGEYDRLMGGWMEDIEKRIRGADKVIIYGAHLTALECARWMLRMGEGGKLLGFAVTDMEKNPKELKGFAVRRLTDYSSQDQDALILLAIPEKYHVEVEQYARGQGFFHFIKVGLDRMSDLKGTRLIKLQDDFPALPFLLKKDKNDPAWLDMVEKEQEEETEEIERRRHYKFPTLFYMEEEKLMEEAEMEKGFCWEYEKTCGCYRNLHMFPVERNLNEKGLELKKILKIFMAFSHWDRKATKTPDVPWICPLQVGSRRSGRKNGSLSDDSGDNISQYNGLFAEMTGAYWIWKQEASSEYKGLCHYRRHFVISKEEILALGRNRIDVILPTPRYVPGGIKNMFLKETPVKSKVFENIFFAVSELYEDEREDFEDYLSSRFYYPNNMVIAKRDIYDRYCSWIFPVLFHMQRSDQKNDYEYTTDRHIAYAAELLTSYFFVKNKDIYQIAVTDYRFIS